MATIGPAGYVIGTESSVGLTVDDHIHYELAMARQIRDEWQEAAEESGVPVQHRVFALTEVDE